MNLALEEKDAEAVRMALCWLREQTESDSCMVCDAAGNVIAQEGQGPWNSALVTALAAGVYGASRELAGVLGQDEFDSVLNQGERTSIFFQSVLGDVLLVSVFSEPASTGLVKLYAARAAGMVRRVLLEKEEASSAADEAKPRLIIKDDTEMFATHRQVAARREQEAVAVN